MHLITLTGIENTRKIAVIKAVRDGLRCELGAAIAMVEVGMTVATFHDAGLVTATLTPLLPHCIGLRVTAYQPARQPVAAYTLAAFNCLADTAA
jgi:hypothetical protein